jgi:hypothetical protein
MDNLDKTAPLMFFNSITDCLVPIPNDKSVELVHLASLGVISSLFPSVRILNAEQQKKTLNLFIGIVGPPASGKSIAMVPLSLLEGVKNYVKSLVTTAGIRKDFPDRTVIIAGDITKPRLIDHLWVNSETGTPTLVAESESSTLVNALGGSHGQFRDVLNKLGENERISYSRKKDNVTVEVNYPMASILLTGTEDQAAVMYETPSGIFSRFLYQVLDGMDEYKPLERSTRDFDAENNCSRLLNDRVKKLFLYYKDSNVIVTPDELTLNLYNVFGRRKTEDFKSALKSDSSFGFRYIFRILKIAGIYALIRYWLEKGGDKYSGNGVVFITADDLELALDHEPALWYALVKVYGMVTSKKVHPHARVLGNLEKNFTRQEFIREYQQQNGMVPNDRTITRFLKDMSMNNQIRKVMKGTYEKL